MNSDRGLKKWTSIMLPEHVKELNKWYAEVELIEPPDLTEWDLQIIQEELEVAYTRQCLAVIRTWYRGRQHTYQGRIEGIDLQASILVLQDLHRSGQINVKDIFGIYCIE